MNIAIIPAGIEYLKNELFNSKSRLNRDNCFEPFLLLKKELLKRGHRINTYDLFNLNEIDILIVYRIDFMIKHFLKVMRSNDHCRVFYMMTEPPIISKLHEFKYLKEFQFDKIFTWNDSEIRKSDQVVKLNYVNPKINTKIIPKVPFNNKQLITTIVGNKSSNFPNELYSERLNVAKYFSTKNEKFSLFGRGWGNDNRSWIKKIWKGEVVEKKEVLQNYKFTLCFENSSGYEGYITEKIFDAFSAGSVPIYYGAKNVEDYIPKNTFINYKDFSSPEKLYERLIEIDENQYLEYQLNIKNYLKTESYKQFCSESFYETLGKYIPMETVERKRSYVALRFRLALGLLQKWRIIMGIKRYFFEITTNI